jgi:hypothetical protein
MKTITGIAFALATLSASPAFAAGQGNWWDAYPWSARQSHDYSGPRGAFAADPRYLPRRSWDVYDTNGRYLGSDPDPNVRDMIARDPEDEGPGW